MPMCPFWLSMNNHLTREYLLKLFKIISMKDSSKTLLAAAAGVAVGSTLGLLLAPEKGSETRKKMDKKFREFANSLSGECSKERLEMAKQKLETHKERVEMHLRRINERLQKSEAKAGTKLHEVIS
jgi:gas vesicle protein